MFQIAAIKGITSDMLHGTGHLYANEVFALVEESGRDCLDTFSYDSPCHAIGERAVVVSIFGIFYLCHCIFGIVINPDYLCIFKGATAYETDISWNGDTAQFAVISHCP